MAKAKGRSLEHFELPNDIIGRAAIATKQGVRILLTPSEFIKQMRRADKALNVPSNAAARDALYELREWLSDVYEEEARWQKGKK